MTLADIAVRYFAGHMVISLARFHPDWMRLKWLMGLQRFMLLASMTWYDVSLLGCRVALAA
jgi:hypothetical protein